MTERFIPAHGGYRELLSFQKAEIVFDATVQFCKRFIDKRDRTYDQMVQAARSGKQNIVEGSQVSGTSKEMELKLTNVARATNFLLDRQIAGLEKRFVEDGGLRERMTSARLRHRRLPSVP